MAEVAVLGTPVRTVGEGLRRLNAIQERFQDEYDRLLHAITACALPAVVCTIYDPRFPDKGLQREAVTALCLFNDVIIRLARRFSLSVLDLRAVCVHDADYATPIEPSASGGAKIANAIHEACFQHDFTRRQTVFLP